MSNEDAVRDFIQTYPVPDIDVRSWNDQCGFVVTPFTDLRGLPMVTVLNHLAQLHIAFVQIWERLSGRNISL